MKVLNFDDSVNLTCAYLRGFTVYQKRIWRREKSFGENIAIRTNKEREERSQAIDKIA